MLLFFTSSTAIHPAEGCCREKKHDADDNPPNAMFTSASRNRIKSTSPAAMTSNVLAAGPSSAIILLSRRYL